MCVWGTSNGGCCKGLPTFVCMMVVDAWGLVFVVMREELKEFLDGVEEYVDVFEGFLEDVCVGHTQGA